MNKSVCQLRHMTGACVTPQASSLLYTTLNETCKRHVPDKKRSSAVYFTSFLDDMTNDKAL